MARNKRLVWLSMRWNDLFHRCIRIFWIYKNWYLGTACIRRLQGILTFRDFLVSLLSHILESLEMHDL